jgi:hypothetical protein
MLKACPSTSRSRRRSVGGMGGVRFAASTMSEIRSCSYRRSANGSFCRSARFPTAAAKPGHFSPCTVSPAAVRISSRRLPDRDARSAALPWFRAGASRLFYCRRVLRRGRGIEVLSASTRGLAVSGLRRDVFRHRLDGRSRPKAAGLKRRRARSYQGTVWPR